MKEILKGFETGVFIPIQDWNLLIQKYSKIMEELDYIVPEWHKEIVRRRLQKINNEPDRLLNWNEVENTIIVE